MQPTTPKIFNLTGRAYDCYRVGDAMGQANAFGLMSENARRLKTIQLERLQKMRDSISEDHPSYTDLQRLLSDDAVPVLLEQMAVQLDQKASERRREGQAMMGQLAAQDTAEEARWRPPLRAWALLAVVMSIATTVATLVATYAGQADW